LISEGRALGLKTPGRRTTARNARPRTASRLPRNTLEGEVQMLNRIKSFLVNEDGPTATEYAVMLALIIIVALAAITALGDRVNTIFTGVTAALPE